MFTAPDISKNCCPSVHKQLTLFSDKRHHVNSFWNTVSHDEHREYRTEKFAAYFLLSPTGSTHEQVAAASSLSDLKEIGCKLSGAVYISPLFWAIEQLLPCKIIKWGKQAFRRKVKARKIYPRSAQFSLRFFKSDRLLEIKFREA
ncbi:hypothetical protein [Candidatus Nitrotoga sp. BS]|uniref:hypothetical protein n=1 Tax=Candidatus Nitrotoga sp. BS TaxID=2890408 RepID=UPI001EF29285|nr:hypothetical protein [Candidatus Nitrotoga sp. BS]